MRKILPILLALIGLGAGVGGGLLLRPPPEDPASNPCGEAAEAPAHAEEEPAKPGAPTHEYVKLNNQFVVPVVEGGRVSALVIISLSLEVKIGTTQQVYSVEPKLRDAFLKVLFSHANAGGFSGAFTNANNMTILRNAMLEAARKVMGETVSDVLISDIIRQDT